MTSGAHLARTLERDPRARYGSPDVVFPLGYIANTLCMCNPIGNEIIIRRPTFLEACLTITRRSNRSIVRY